MSDLRLAIPLAIAVFGILLLLLRPWRRSAGVVRTSIDGETESIRPRHFRYFPQIRQALSATDDEYLRKAASPRIAKQVRRERRAIARSFLRGLREDFGNLEQLGRMIAGLSAVVSRHQETERWFLSLKFQMLYALVWLSLSTGRIPLQQMEHLTGLVGRLAIRMEQAMAQINALAAEQDPRGLNA